MSSTTRARAPSMAATVPKVTTWAAAPSMNPLPIECERLKIQRQR
jgi:hypothetical protein